jgi:hypothetical protein
MNSDRSRKCSVTDGAIAYFSIETSYRVAYANIIRASAVAKAFEPLPPECQVRPQQALARLRWQS